MKQWKYVWKMNVFILIRILAVWKCNTFSIVYQKLYSDDNFVRIYSIIPTAVYYFKHFERKTEGEWMEVKNADKEPTTITSYVEPLKRRDRKRSRFQAFQLKPSVDLIFHSHITHICKCQQIIRSFFYLHSSYSILFSILWMKLSILVLALLLLLLLQTYVI